SPLKSPTIGVCVPSTDMEMVWLTRVKVPSALPNQVDTPLPRKTTASDLPSPLTSPEKKLTEVSTGAGIQSDGKKVPSPALMNTYIKARINKTKSVLPSPLKSPASTTPFPPLTALLAVDETSLNVPSPLPKNVLIGPVPVAELESNTRKSVLPSPLKSPLT